MGIRQKIRLGFFALGLLLFFSGLMSYFELNKLSNSTRNMLDASLKNMELSKEMLDAVQDQNTALLQIMVTGSAEYDSLLFAGRAKFDAAIREAKISIRDLRGLDSIYAANVQYTGVINNFFDNRAKTGRSDMNWFVGVYKTSYYDLTASIKNFMVSSQSVMDAKTAQLESNAYRAIMPGIIALAIAIIIIVMFSYFIDLYYVRPVLKITEGLHNYLNSKIPFKITMEGRDEVHKLKEYIEALIGLLKNKKSKAGNRAVISILVAVIIMISFYAISRSVAIDDQRKAMGYLQESSNYRTIQQEIKEEAVYTFQLKDVSSNEGQKVYESEGNTIYLSDVEEETDAYLIYFEASGEFSTQGGSIVSVVSHDIEKKHKAYELEGSVNVILDSGMQELPWMYLSVNKTKNKDEYGFRLSKALVAGQSSVKLQLKDLVKTTWTHK